MLVVLDGLAGQVAEHGSLNIGMTTKTRQCGKP